MSEARDHPYAAFLHRVQKPSRYVGSEQGQARKPWDAVRSRMCLAFPDVYEVGMSHLGFKILYSIINGRSDLLAERAYAPWLDMERELRQRNEPLRSLESGRSLADFDVVGFSLQFELTFTNVLQMLDLSGIPLRSRDRDGDHPLVVAGGPTATHPEALAEFVDAFLIGDGEEQTPALMRRWAACQHLPRAERLAELAQLRGLYVPSLYATERDPATGLHYVARARRPEAPLPVQRAFVQNVSDHPFPSDGPVAHTETVFDRVSVEIARGCTEGCRFCQAGMIYRPVRERDPDEIVDVIETSVRRQGYDEASLTSLSTADYSAIAPLIRKVAERLEDRRVSLSVSSLRAYGLEERVLDDLKALNARGLTFAPEAGTQRMRDVINKNVTEEQLLETARRVFSRGWDRMKLYFMIGLPTEEDEDVRGIVETGARALAIGRKLRKGRAKVTVSVSTHVPKPHTPFQWCALDGEADVLRKQNLLRDAARACGVNLKMHDSDGSWLEGVLARGDRRLCDVVERAYLNGARFDSWSDQLDLDAWKRAFDSCGLEPRAFLGTLPTDARLPWDHIDVGLAEGFLQREYRRSLKNRLSPPCGKAAGMFVHHTNLADHERDQRKLVCYHCGVACDMTKMREERAEFLVKLDALRPDARPRRDAAERPKPGASTQAPPVRVRLCYTRLGAAAFSSHLDMVRLLPRMLRRAGLPLAYSQGYHPKPLLTFGPALSLGISSLSEYVDIKLAPGSEVDCAALVDELNRVAIEGLRFVGAARLSDRDPKLSRIIDRVVYVAALPHAALQQLGASDDATQLQALIDQRRGPELTARRVIEGVGRKIPVGQYLIDARAGAGGRELDRAGLLGELMPVSLTLRITGRGTAKPSEALECLLGATDLPARFVRAALLCERAVPPTHPLDLAALRQPAVRADAEQAGLNP